MKTFTAVLRFPISGGKTLRVSLEAVDFAAAVDHISWWITGYETNSGRTVAITDLNESRRPRECVPLSDISAMQKAIAS